MASVCCLGAFFVVGKMFCLRGGTEHRHLKLSQLHRSWDPDQYTYYENVSKTSDGSFRKMRLKHKVVPLFANPDIGDRCPVKVLDTYISKLPPKAIEADLFYVRPLFESPPDPSLPWYTSVPVGKDTLSNKLKLMCKHAGVKGNKTNHSLRAASATQMYANGVPEKLIQERTGHRSLDALRMYERSSQQQHQAVSKILSAGPTHTQTTLKETTIDISTTKTVENTNNGSTSFNFQNLHGCTINIMDPSQTYSRSINS